MSRLVCIYLAVCLKRLRGRAIKQVGSLAEEVLCIQRDVLHGGFGLFRTLKICFLLCPCEVVIRKKIGAIKLDLS
jgi:hypothetical protein